MTTRTELFESATNRPPNQPGTDRKRPTLIRPVEGEFEAAPTLPSPEFTNARHVSPGTRPRS